VSVPLTWEGVGRADPSAYDVTTVPRRLAALRKDPWDGYEHARRALSGDMIAVVGAGKE
jgi:bifunctional non-homologous end joining protein LigD